MSNESFYEREGESLFFRLGSHWQVIHAHLITTYTHPPMGIINRLGLFFKAITKARKPTKPQTRYEVEKKRDARTQRRKLELGIGSGYVQDRVYTCMTVFLRVRLANHLT